MITYRLVHHSAAPTHRVDVQMLTQGGWYTQFTTTSRAWRRIENYLHHADTIAAPLYLAT